MRFQFAHRTLLVVNALSGAMFAGWLCWSIAASADNTPGPSTKTLDAIIVTAKKRPEPVADEKLTQQIASALHSDPYFFDEHVTVTVKNGIARLEGVVFDDSDVFHAIRIARRIAGVRRVVTDFYIPDGQ